MAFGLVLSAVLIYVTVTSDPTEGLDYASGDKPEEMRKPVCFSDSGPCPPTGFKWIVPASGVVQTRFAREEIDERTKFRGWVRLDAAMFTKDEVRSCAATVDWSLLADGKPVARGTIKADSEDREVAGRSPREARFVLFTARRTDSLPCSSTLQWVYAGLD
ncbi:hypothetical protein [Actinomadura sediminis]|uniref:Uncharacterized protein n=1 Tax=Actinomadura sediminis TaxID=1038904 RepID=A0ABW3EIS5_9ACTN